MKANTIYKQAFVLFLVRLIRISYFRHILDTAPPTILEKKPHNHHEGRKPVTAPKTVYNGIKSQLSLKDIKSNPYLAKTKRIKDYKR